MSSNPFYWITVGLFQAIETALEERGLVSAVDEGDPGSETYGVLYGDLREDGFKDWAIRCTLQGGYPKSYRTAVVPKIYSEAPTVDLRQACETAREYMQDRRVAPYLGATTTPVDVCDTLSSFACILGPVWNARVAEIEEEVQRGVGLFATLKDAPELARIDAKVREAFWFEVVVYEGRP